MAINTDTSLVVSISSMLGRMVNLDEAVHINRTIFAMWVQDRLDTPYKIEEYIEELRNKS